MTIGTVQEIVHGGLAATYGSVSSSQTLLGAGPGCFLAVKNASGSPINVTLTDPGLTAYGSAATNPVVAVADGTEKFIPLPKALRNPSDATVTVAFSATTTVTAALLHIA